MYDHRFLKATRAAVLFAWVGVLFSSPGCSEKPSEMHRTERVALLAKADAFDGDSDHVVSKCAVCALHMDGKAEHPVKDGEYELHFCSDHCAQAYTDDGEDVLRRLTFEE